MDLRIIATGAIRKGAERDLIDDYLSRLQRAGPQVGFRRAEEVECRAGGGPEAEASRLLARCGDGAHIIALDEAGQARSSAGLAADLGKWRDRGCPQTCFLIGGAEGHGDPVNRAAHETLALGVQTWPHRLVRILIAEQLYRAATILAGQPYHKS
ncbi:MAG: 23S rRNA (pseudouridine(1915)-N(3))-methyltransferase RlmH [Alphaproteobacteria bacterium]|nr:23S rRNA (pseudouridine(1915)-N(3))-methyltransferase RlmH [Alphaproteobacteria bacterium]